jgi:Glycoside hydrolase family 44/Bacterial Ig-like domain (group 3)
MRMKCGWALFFVSFLVTAATAQTLSVDANSSRHPISPDIYGLANYGLDATFAKEIQVPNVRWGGDATTRYNWMVDSSNTGFDFYFMGGSGVTNPVPSASVDQMVTTYKPATSLITIPIIPYINKSAVVTCSFPVSIYGAQQSTNPYTHPNGDSCGNSIATGGAQLVDNDILANHIANTTSLQQQWVQHLVSTFGTAANGGVKYYQLDNEPLGWSNTHRDVMPVQDDYPTITQLGEQYATAVKQGDSTAKILGPSDFTLGGWVGDSSKQGGIYAGQYFLQQMAAYDKQHSQRTLDYFDEHYYFDVSSPAAQLASTRTLWDSTFNGGTWVEQYDFMGPMQLIPRFRGWISTYYPGTLLALSEYSIDSGKKSVVDAIAEMDVLGIFGREPIDFANMWNTPAPTDPIAYAFRMFRSYDGKSSQFGDTSISAVSSDQSSLSIYAAQRSTDNAVTILVINKTTASIKSAIALANLSLPSTAQVFTYSQASLTSIGHPSDAAITSNSLGYTFPGYSATLFVVQPTATTPPPTTTTVTLAASPASGVSGQALALTATVAPSSSTGTVTFEDGGKSIGTATLSSGSAMLSVSTLAVGTHSITAVYGSTTSNAVTVTITAAATTPDYGLTLSGASLTIASGSTGSLMVAVAPNNGFNASLSFACTGLPTGWGCAFAPATLSGTSAQSTKMTISATNSSQLRQTPSRLFLAAISPIPFFLLGLFGRKFRSVRWAMAIVCMLVMVGCSGSSGGPNSGITPPPQTQSNTYNVTVTASGSSAPTHTQTFALTVTSTQ